MALDEESVFAAPKPKPAAHEIGENVDSLSAPEIEERIALCRAEISRLEAAKSAREATKAAADAIFKR